MKIGRQAKIVELVNTHDIETQEELADLLNSAGYNVTQATISRDIRELKLTKVSTDRGRQKYVVLRQSGDGMAEKYVQVLKNGFLSMDSAQNILVIKTVSGMAMAVGAAIDHLNMNGVVGCIAGDDTVMCAIRTTDDTLKVMRQISRLLED
ncbi:MAG: arginine repressor [Lachnospiraceae bacterium]|nr:arginine repressor [Lachnospiraceae bacterium]MBQ9562316.1 arginine repressor [Lachnospiraceae bacterium]MBR0153785.1 arginine repressor [Lachnospiraceae bacterium]